jgi:tetratricopeptide (TPR) repeat protein
VKAPLVETLDLQGAAGGRYALVADLLDGTGERLVERTTPFDVSPRAVVSRPWVMRDSLDGENHPLVQTALAEQYLMKGDKERARALCQRAVAEEPNLVAARIILGRMSLDDGNPKAAIRLLEPAHAQHPDNSEVSLALGDAHFQVRHYARAVELFEGALETQRPGPSLLNALGTAHAQLGNRERAIEYFRRSLELDPTQAGVQSVLEKLLAQVP